MKNEAEGAQQKILFSLLCVVCFCFLWVHHVTLYQLASVHHHNLALYLKCGLHFQKTNYVQ